MKLTLPAALVAAIILAPTAHAVPGDPEPGCQTLPGGKFCDGPIRPDGSWKRCAYNPGLLVPGRYGSYMPPTTHCFMVPGLGQVPALPLGQPPHHIS